MATSTIPEIKKFLDMKARKLIFLFSLSILSLASTLAQPVWVPTTPSIPSTGALSITANYGINMVGTVYITVVNFDFSPTPTSAQVRAGAIAGPAGGRVATAVLPVTIATRNLVLNTILSVINANTIHSVFLVAENGVGTLQATPVKLLCTTLPCPKLNLFTFFGNLGECINLGAQGMFQAAPLGALPTGVLKGTTWTIDWGDGSPVWTYPSAADNDIPPAQIHTYNYPVTECAYVGRWVVKNPCNEFLSSSSVFVVHGRDIPTDGDGLLRIEEVTTHTPDIIYLCEGKQHNITLADISIWNCQLPNLPLPLNPADYDNDKPRTIQFIYGKTPGGALMNTIGANVQVGGVNVGAGIDGPVITPINPPNPNTQTAVITIPATSLVGQRFYVYIKNWNKCNLYTGNPAVGYEYEDFIIEIIDAPPPPIVVTPKNYCFGSVPLTISATPNLVGNTINWYADAGLTLPVLYTGNSYTHGKTAVGTTNYWVTETSGVNGCEGPAAQITLNINSLPIISQVVGDPTICTGSTASISVANSVLGTRYQLRLDSNDSPVGASVNGTGGIISLSATPAATTIYNVFATITATGCQNELTDKSTVTVDPLSVGGSITGGTTPLCLGSATGTMTLSGHTGSVVQWEKRLLPSAVWTTISNITTTYSETPSAVGTWEYRTLVKSGSCSSVYSSVRAIVVNPATVPGTLSGGTTPICLGSSTGVMTLAGYTGNIIDWEYQLNGGSWFSLAYNNPSNNWTPGISGTFGYRVKVQSSPCSVAYSNVITIVVNPTTAGGSVSGGTTPLCIGSGTGTMTLSGHTGSIVQWEKQLGAGGWVVIANITTTYSETPSSAGTWQYRALVKSGSCASSYSTPKTIVVNPTTVPGTLSGGTTPICLGSSTGVMTLTAYTGSIIRWEYQLNGTGWNTIANTNPTFNGTPGVSGSFEYRVRVRSSPCAVEYSNIVTIVVDPTSVGGSITGGTTPICIGSVTGTMTLSGHTGSVVQWEKRLLPSAIWTVISNITTTYSETPLAAGTWEYRAYVQSGTCAPVYSGTKSIVVNVASVGGSITGGSTPVCYGVNTGVMTLSGHTGSVVRWEKRVDAGTWSSIANITAAYSEVPTGSGTWEYRAFVQNGVCPEISSAVRTIVVRPRFQLAQLHDDASICVGFSTNFNIAMTGGVSPYTANYTRGVTPLVVNNYVSGTPVSTGPLAVTTAFTLTSVTDANGCNVESLGSLITITVGAPLLSATLAGSGDACSGVSSWIKSVMAGGAPPYTINYTRNGMVQPAITPYTSNTNYDLAILPVGSYTYAITSVQDLCGNFVPGGGLPAPVTININGIPDISATVNNTPLICNDASLNITLNSTVNNTIFNYTVASVPAAGYSWTAGKDPVNGSITDADGNGTETLSRQLQHNYNAAVVVTYTITPTGPGATACPGTPITRSVTVNPVPAVTAMTRSVCSAIAFTATPANGSDGIVPASMTYTWGVPVVTGGLTGGVAGSGASVTGTLTNPTNTAQTATYTVTPSTATCTGSNFTVTVTVDPVPAILPLTATVCSKATFTVTPLNVFNGIVPAGTTYSWAVPIVTGGITGGATGSGSAVISGTLTNPTTLVQTATYSVTPLSGSCAGALFNVTVTVNPLPKTSDITGEGFLCETATNKVYQVKLPRSAGSTYAWTVPASLTISAPPPPSDLYFIIVDAVPGMAMPGDKITVTETFTSTTGCVGAPVEFPVVVSASKIGELVAGPTPVCEGSTMNHYYVSSTLGSIYSWSLPPGAFITSVPDNTADIFVTYPVSISGQVSVIETNGACTTFHLPLNVVVNPRPVLSSSLTPPAICSGSPFNYSATSSTAGASFAWSRSGILGINGGSGSSGTGNVSEILTNTTTAPVNVTYVYTTTAAGCSGNPQNVVVTVNPSGQVNDPPDMVLCNGSSTSAIIFSTTNSGGSTAYSWTNSAPGIGLAATGSGNIASFTAVNNGTAPVTATITVTPTFTNVVSCPGTQQTFTITVNPVGQVNDPANQTVCNGSATTLVTFTTVNTVGTTTYSWTNSVPGIGLAASGLGDIAPFTALNAGTSPVVATITVTPHFNYSSFTCDGPAQTFTMTINPTGQINDPPDQLICNGSPVSSVIFTTSNSGGVTTYSWANNTPSIGLAATGSGNIASFAAVNIGTAPVTATITVTPAFTNNTVSCTGPAETFTITVNPSGQVNDPANEVLCNGTSTAPVTFATINTGGATTYSWTNTASGIGLAASGTGDIASFPAINTGTGPVIATIAVTPHFTNGSLTCNGPAQTYTITVNPASQVNDPADQVVCNGSSVTAVNFTTNHTGGTTTYTWVNDNPGIGLVASGNTNIASFNAVNIGTSPVVATITVTPHFTNSLVTCDGPVQTFTITVNPTGQVNDPADQVVCNGSSAATVTFGTANTGGTTSYTWTNDLTSIGLGASGSGNIPFFTAINGGTAPVTANIIVTPHFANGSVICNGPSQTFTITVNPTAQVNDPANQVVCNGLPTAAVNFTTNNTVGLTTYSWTNTAPGIGLAASGLGDIAAFTALNAGTSPVVATIIVTPHFANGSLTCDGPAQSFTITVNPTGQVNDPADQVVCKGTLVTAVNFTTGNTGGITTYSWANDNTTIGLGTTGTGNISAFTAINTGTTPVVSTVTVTPHFTNSLVTCDGPVQTFTITVNPTGQVNDPANQVVCNGSATAAVAFSTINTVGTTTYSWTNTAPGIGLAVSGLGDIAAFTALNAGTSPVVATITVTPHFDNGSLTCNGPAKTFTLTVNPTGQVNVPANQILCNGSLATPVTFATVNTGGTTTYTWSNDNTSIGLGVGATGNIGAFTATNITSAPVVATITVTPHYTNGSVTCDGPAETFTITVNPSGNVADPADQVLCNGSATAAVLFTTTNTGGTTTFSWTNSAPGIGLAVSGIGDIATFTASNITSSPVVATITVTPHFTNGSLTCNGPVQTFTITVNPTGQVNDPASQTLCTGSSTSAVIFATTKSGGITTYDWVNDNPAIGLPAIGSGDIAAFTAANPGTTPIFGTITVTPHFTNGLVTCDGPAKTFTITVNPAGQVNDPSDQVVCSGSSTASVIFSTANTGGSTTYTWTNDLTTIGLGAGGSGSIPFFTAINAGTVPVIATITVTPHFTNNSVNCDGTPQTFTITVNPMGQVNAPASQVVCKGLPTTPINFTTNNSVGITTYTWVNNTPSIGLAASGSADIGSFAAINAGTSPVVATITVTPHFDNGSVTCDGNAKTFTITVNPTGQVNVPANQTVCNGSTVTAINFSTLNTGGTTTYSWTNSAPGIGLPALGSGNIASFIAANPGTSPVTATITVTPHYTNGTVTCDGLPQTFTLTVNPTAQVNDPADQVLCNGSLTTAVTFATINTIGTTTYTWTNNATSIGLAANGSGDILPFNAVNTGISPIVATITVTPHFDNGSVTCNGPVQSFTITVNPTGQVNDPINQVICNGTSTSVTFTTANAGGLTSYTWVNDNPAIGLAALGSGNILPFAALNPGTAPVVATITVTPHFANGLPVCDGPSQSFNITVNPAGQVSDPADQVACNGTYTAPVVFATANTGGTTTFTWTNDLTSIGLGASGSGNISAFGAINNGTATVTATLTVTPHFTNGLITCDGPPQTFTITVNPAAQVIPPANQVVCNGSPVTAVTFATNNTGGITTYTWTNSAPGIGLVASGSGNIASFPAVNSGTFPVTATITVTPHFDNGLPVCDGPVQTFTITVNPTGQMNDPVSQVVCNGSNSTAVNFTTVNSGGTTTYDWVNSASGIGLAASGSGNIPSFTALNPGTTPIVATITVTPHFVNSSVTCDGPIKTFTITVNPPVNVTTVSPATICSAATTNIAMTSNAPGATFSWTIGVITGGITGASSSSGSTIAQILINPGVSAGTVTYIVTPAANSCSGTPLNIVVTVNPVPNVTSLGPTTICSGTATNIALNSNVAGTTFTWTVGAITGGITGATPSGGSPIAQTLTNPGTTSGTVTYVVTPVANSCPGIPVNIVVTVNPSPDVTTASLTTICSGTATNIALTGNVSGTNFSWTIGVVTGAVSGATASNGSTIAQTLYNTGLAAGTVEYIVTPAANSCSGTPVTIIVTVNPLTGPTLFTSGAMEVCQDAPDETYTATAANSTSITYSVSPATAGVINATTGDMNWDAAFSGTAKITATSAGLCGTTVSTVPVRVKGLPAITKSPADRTICEFGLVNFDVTATGSDLTYQWFVDENAGTFIPVPGGGAYSGETSPTLQIWSPVRSMNNYKYHVVVSGCLPDVTSADAALTVNTAPELTLHPSDASVCFGNNAVMLADATGTSVTWQWYVNKGAGFVLVTPDTHFSGETTQTLTITNALATFNNWIFRAKATGICGAPAFTNFGRLSVINPPTVTLQPVARVICENGNTSFLGNGSGYTGLQWQVSTDNGATYTNVVDDAIFIGSGTNQLSILNAPATLNNNQYRLGLIGACITIYTNAAKLTVNSNPVVDFTAIDPINACGGVPIVINGNPTGGSGIYAQHRWTGDVGPLNGYIVQSPTFNSQIPGTYNLNYRVTDSKGCTANDDLAVIVDSPSADFTQTPDNGCTPLTVAFTKDMTGIASFSWDFGDGSPVETATASPVHLFSNTNPSTIGYYNVKLTVRSPGGCFNTFTSMVTVYPAIDATFTASTNIVCSGNSIVFTSLPGASKYFWDYGDGVSGYATNGTSHLYTNFTTAPVVNQVKLTTTSFYNCTDVNTFNITVMPVPLPQFTAVPVSQIYSASGNPVTFTNTTNAGSWNWLWKFGDGATSAVQDPGHTYTVLGDFIVTLVVNNANCSDSVKHTVNVLPIPPVANFDSIPSGCSPLAITLNNTSLNTATPGTIYKWDFGDGSTSTAKNPTYTYFDPGTYRVELIVTGPGGVSSKSQVVNAYPSPKAYFEVAPAVVFVNDEKVRCFNLSQGADSYLWEFGDGDTSKVKEPFHKYMEEGVYDITLWAYSNNGCSDRYILSPGVTVEPAGVIRFSTVFTPNKDGEIDMDHLPTGGTEIDQFFYPPIREKVINYKLQIFNRWGVLIFETHDINKPWNGYYKGKLCPQGVYVWYVEGKYANGQPFKNVGDVTLLH